jgi:hypothetical protein
LIVGLLADFTENSDYQLSRDSFCDGNEPLRLTFRHFMALLWIHIGTENTPENNRSGGGLRAMASAAAD